MELWCSVESLFETILENQSLQSDFSLTSNPGVEEKRVKSWLFVLKKLLYQLRIQNGQSLKKYKKVYFELLK